MCHLVLHIQPTQNYLTASEGPLEETKFSFPNGYWLEIVLGVGMYPLLLGIGHNLVQTCAGPDHAAAAPVSGCSRMINHVNLVSLVFLVPSFPLTLRLFLPSLTPS